MVSFVFLGQSLVFRMQTFEDSGASNCSGVLSVGSWKLPRYFGEVPGMGTSLPSAAWATEVQPGARRDLTAAVSALADRKEKTK